MTLLATVFVLAQTQAVCPVVWTGMSSHVSEPRSVLIETEQDWLGIWLEHTGQDRANWPLKNPMPEIDFKSFNILAIFGGKVNQTAGYSAHSLDRTGDLLTFKFIPRVYAVGFSEKPPKDAFLNTPYGFFLLPKGYHKIKLEEGVLESKTLPPSKFKPFGEVVAKPVGS